MSLIKRWVGQLLDLYTWEKETKDILILLSELKVKHPSSERTSPMRREICDSYEWIILKNNSSNK